MKGKIFKVGILWPLTIALILALCLVPISSNRAAAQSLGDYFSYSYEAEFSKTQIRGSEVFYATMEAEAACYKSLPLSVSQVSMTGRIIARHQVTGDEVELNSSYTTTIDPFPSQEGETTQVTKTVPLQFPQGSQSGTYSVVGELIEAKIQAMISLNVTRYLPSSQQIGSITYVSVNGGGGGGGGVSGVPPPAAGHIDVSGSVSTDGTFTKTVVAQSFDGKCELTINEDTRGLTQEGDPLTEITMTEMEDPPAPPVNSNIIGLTYDLGPDGATFNPTITFTITYDESLIPEGIAEENLVVAMWDEAVSKWVELEGSTVDPVTHTITAPVSHFTAFTVMDYVRPAVFTTSSLNISPAEVDIDGGVTISTVVTNTGDLSGSYEVTLKIDDVVVATEDVTLAGGDSQKVTFTTTRDVAGTYTVNVNGLSGAFVVSIPSKPMIWQLVGGITAACITIGVFIWLAVRRRTRQDDLSSS